MKQSLKPNRSITMGDRGERAVRSEFTKREQREAYKTSVQAIKVRMQAWTDDFIIKVYHENKIPAWHQAAKETLNERKVHKPGQPHQPAPKPKKRHKKKRWNRGTQSERDARSLNWKLDRQLDQRIAND